jgi:hypothetical protein
VPCRRCQVARREWPLPRHPLRLARRDPRARPRGPGPDDGEDVGPGDHRDDSEIGRNFHDLLKARPSGWSVAPRMLGHRRQQLLGQHRRHVRAAVGGNLAAQEPDDRVPAGIRRGLAYPQPVEERQQRQCLAEFVTGTPEHLAAGLRRPLHRGPHQRGLADARFALDEHRTAAPPATSLISPVSSAISLSRPTSAPAGVTGDMGRTLLPEYLRNKRAISGH